LHQPEFPGLREWESARIGLQLTAGGIRMGTLTFGRRVASHVMLFSAAFVLAAATAHAGEAQLGVADVSAGEGAGNLDFNVVRSGDTSSEIVVPYSLTPGTATSGSDYNAPANGVVRIAPGLTQGIVSVPVVNDTQGEGDETLSLHLGNPAAFGAASGFVGPPAIGTGSNGLDNMVVADFDGDSRPDIATANFEGSISVILHDTGGALLAARNYAVSGHPNENLAVGDFNGDGKPDIVTTISGSNVIAVLLNGGAGNFPSEAHYTLSEGAGSKRIAIADFNGDGKPDLAIGRFRSWLTVLLNDGSGGFPTSEDFTLPYGPNGLVDVVTGDFDGDGKPDIATAGYFGAGLQSTSTLSVLLNDGNGGFLAPLDRPIDREPVDIVTADFDDDGKLDVAEAAVGLRGVGIYFGSGTGGFDRHGFDVALSGGDVEALDVADFNGDGKSDLAVRDGLNNRVAALLNNGSGAFPPGGVIGYTALGRIRGVAAGDFNGDGKPDLAASTSNSVSVLNQNGSGGFQSPVAAVPAPVSVATADFNGDGKPDTATAGKGGPTVVLNDGSGGFLGPVSYSGGSTSGIVAADLDGDGKPDLATTNSDSTLTVARNDGSGHFSIAGSYPVGTGPNCVAVADFDTDGKPDLAVANFSSHDVSVLRNDGHGGFLGAVNHPLGNTVALCLTAADFNGDGKPDLAVATAVNNISIGSFAGSVTLMLNDGSGGFLTAVRYAVGPKPTSLAAADFNGDNKVDLAVAIHGDAVTNDSAVSVLRNDGNGGFLPAVDHDAAIDPLNVVAADFNGDGRPDLAVTADVNALVSVLLSNGSGGLSPAVTYADGGEGGSLATADFNGDSKPDLALASKVRSNLAVLLNAPDATAVLSDGTAIGTIIDDDAGTVDTTPPDSAIDTGPTDGSRIRQTGATFTYHGIPSSDTSAFECKLDAGSFEGCPDGGRTYSNLGDGAHTFSVRAVDAAGNRDQSAATRTWTVDTTPPTITVTTPSANAQFVVGQSVAADYACTDDSGIASCDGPVADAASISMADPGAKTFAVTATDTAGNTASKSVTYTVNKAATTTALGSSVNPAAIGQATTYTATVTVSAPGAGAPTGSMAFTDAGSPVVGCNAVAVDAGGEATCAVAYPTPGSHAIKAVYGGSSRFAGSEKTLTQTIGKAATTVTAARAVSKFLLRTTFSATLKRSHDGAPLAGRTIAFTVGSGRVCSATTNSAGEASCTVLLLVIGTSTYTATFDGDGGYMPSKGSAQL
jgi:hypothetical protein